MTARAQAGFFINQPNSSVRQFAQSRLDIRNPVGDVVQSRASLVQKLLDGRIGRGRLQELDFPSARADKSDVDFLRFHALDRGTTRPCQEFV